MISRKKKLLEALCRQRMVIKKICGELEKQKCDEIERVLNANCVPSLEIEPSSEKSTSQSDNRKIQDITVAINPFENFPEEIAKTYDDANKILKDASEKEGNVLDEEDIAYLSKLNKELKDEANETQFTDVSPDDDEVVKSLNGKKKKKTYKDLLERIYNYVKKVGEC